MKQSGMLLLFLILFFFLNYSNATVFKTCIQDFYPKGFQEQGRVQGYSVDIFEALQKIDKNITFKGYDRICNIAKIEADLEAGRIDIFIAGFRTPERERKFYFINLPIYMMRFMMVVRKNDPVEIKSLAELNGKPDNSILTLSGTAMQRFLEEEPGLHIDASAESVDENLKKLEAGKGRFFFISNLGLDHTLEKPQWRGKFRILPANFGTDGQYVLLSRKLSGKDIELLQHALSSLRNTGKLDKIFQVY